MQTSAAGILRGRDCPAGKLGFMRAYGSVSRRGADDSAPTGNSAFLLPKAKGFTLLEILVVVFIIGIILTFASLSINNSDSRVLEEEAKRLMALIKLGSQQAVLESQELAVVFKNQGYEFQRIEEGKWLPLVDDVLKTHSFPANLEVEVDIEGELLRSADKEDKKTQDPRLFLLSSGEMTAFTLTLKNDATEQTLTLVGNESGDIQLRKPKEER